MADGGHEGIVESRNDSAWWDSLTLPQDSCPGLVLGGTDHLARSPSVCQRIILAANRLHSPVRPLWIG